MATMMNSAVLAETYLQNHPGTTLTKNAIKVMLRSGCIPSVTAGNRVYYSLEAFEQYLEQGDTAPSQANATTGYGKIRKIV